MVLETQSRYKTWGDSPRQQWTKITLKQVEQFVGPGFCMLLLETSRQGAWELEMGVGMGVGLCILRKFFLEILRGFISDYL